jgi:1-aminocyclopropane-1-carboxylate deaminase/D-cysteine desulfhydrase-like pyridoxal-dependent ACC family enzyme
VGLRGSGIPVIGISCAGSKEEIAGLVLDLANRTAAKLGHPADFTGEQVEVVDDYVGPGYGIPTPGMIEAVDLCGSDQVRLHHRLLPACASGRAIIPGLVDF